MLRETHLQHRIASQELAAQRDSEYWRELQDLLTGHADVLRELRVELREMKKTISGMRDNESRYAQQVQILHNQVREARNVNGGLQDQVREATNLNAGLQNQVRVTHNTNAGLHELREASNVNTGFHDQLREAGNVNAGLHEFRRRPISTLVCMMQSFVWHTKLYKAPASHTNDLFSVHDTNRLPVTVGNPKEGSPFTHYSSEPIHRVLAYILNTVLKDGSYLPPSLALSDGIGSMHRRLSLRCG